LLAIFLRLYFFIGFVGGHPQDDGILINTARAVSLGAFSLERYRDLPPDYLADPSETFRFRVAFVYPLAFLFRLLGAGELATGVLALGISLGSLLSVFAISRSLFDERVALWATLAAALFPFDILQSTRVLTDPLLACLAGFAFLLYFKGRQEKTGLYWGACGIVFGLAYLAKSTGLPLFFLLLALGLVDRGAAGKRLQLLYCVAGFSLILLVEGIYYAWQTGEFFLHYRVASSSVVLKYMHEPLRIIQWLPFLRIEWADAFYYHISLLLNWRGYSAYQLSGFGLYYYLILGGAALVLAKREASGRILLAWLALVYLYFELAPLHVSSQDGVLVYRGIYKQLHYLSVLTPAALPFAGRALAALWNLSRYLGAGLLSVVVLSSLPALRHDYQVLRGSQADLRTAAGYLESSQKTIWSDHLALDNLKFYLGGRASQMSLRELSRASQPSAIEDGYVLLGGSRGIEIVSRAVLDGIPEWAREITRNADHAPPGWRKVLTVPGPRNECREFDLVVFEVSRPGPALKDLGSSRSACAVPGGVCLNNSGATTIHSLRVVAPRARGSATRLVGLPVAWRGCDRSKFLAGLDPPAGPPARRASPGRVLHRLAVVRRDRLSTGVPAFTHHQGRPWRNRVRPFLRPPLR